MKINHSFQINSLKLKNDSPPPPHFLENYFAEVKLKTITNHFSSLLIFTINKTILSTFFLLFLNFTKSCKISVDRDRVERSGNDNSG